MARMLTAMIAEDELLVRIGIASCVPWNELELMLVSEAEDGVCAIVCSASDLTPPLLLLRCETASLLLGEYRGFFVPEASVFETEDGQTCLYAAVGGIAEQIPVEILYSDPETGSLLVAPAEHNTLYDGSTVVIQPDRAYDGMVLS